MGEKIKLANDKELRVMPHSLEAERSVLGAILLDERALQNTLDIIKTEDFYRDRHRKIFQAQCFLFEQGYPIDIISVKDYLEKKGELEEVGGVEYLSSLLEGTPTIANARYHAEIIKKKSLSRKLIEIASKIRERGLEDKEDVEEQLSFAELEILGLSEERPAADFTNIDEILVSTLKHLDELKSPDLIVGLRTGFTKLDFLTLGLRKGDMIIIAGRPSTGKSAFALDIARNVALRQGKAVGIFSMEMTRRDISLRLLAAEAEVDSQKMWSGSRDPLENRRIHAAARKMAEAKILIDDTPGISIVEMRAKARRMKAKDQVELIIVDYLQLMQLGEMYYKRKRIENRQQEISEISRNLKIMARDLNIPIIVISQLNRSIELRKEKKPLLSDLRESGAIEQDGDIVMFLHRPEESTNTDVDNISPTEVVQLIIGKHRNGPTGKIDLVFLKNYMSFRSKADEPEKPSGF